MRIWKKPILNRHLEVYLLYPVFASAVVIVVGAAAINAWEGWAHRPSDTMARWVGVAGWIAAAFAVRWCIVWFRPTIWHGKNGAQYPSALRAALIGYMMFLATWQWSDVSAGERTISVSWAGVPLVVFWGWWRFLVASPQKKPKQTKMPKPSTVAVDERPLGEILRWAKENEPITTAGRDLFVMSEKAAVVAHVLATPRGEGQEELRQAVAIRGNFGVGKTSLINLAREILEHERPGRFLFVDANCWGFESSAKAKEHVLENCVDTLNDHVDCNLLRRIPTYYGEAVGGAPGWAKPAAAFVLAASPAAELKAFGPILKAIDAYLVVAIEDADRNGRDFDTGQILALLHHLREVPRVSFIVSASRDSSVELFKVVERTVFLDPADPLFVLKIINKLRDAACQKTGYLDPETLRCADRKNSRVRDLADPQAFRGQYLPTVVNWGLDLAGLLGSIRVLKGVLRDFDSAWQRHLWGEVDVDQLLIVHALRHGAPQVFDFLRRYQPEIDSLPDTAGDWRESAEALAIAERWKQECTTTGYEARPAAALVAQLYPKLAPIIGARRPNRRMALQSVAGPNGARYWGRIVSGVVFAEDLSDRTLFRTIADLSRDVESAPETLAQMILADPRIATEVVRAAGELKCLKQSHQLAVISQLLADRRAHPKAHGAWHDAPWSKMREWLPTTGGVVPDLYDWFEREIAAALPDHPQLAANLLEDLEGLLAHPRDLQRGQIMLRVFRKKWRPLPPAALARSFAGQPAELGMLLRPILRDPQCLTDLAAEDHWLPSLMLEALRAEPAEILVPMLFAFKLDDSLSSDSSEDYFDQAAIEHFFRQDAELYFQAVVKAASAAPSVMAQSSFLMAMIDNARHLAGEPTPPQDTPK